MKQLHQPELTPNALETLKRRYLSHDESGAVLETPADLFLRVAEAIAGVEKKWGASEAEIRSLAESFYELMAKRLFLPNSPTLMNAGRELGQLSACFVLPVEDSMEGIFETLKSAAMIHKTGGGTGFSFSRLRPKGSRVASTNGVASGPVSFMKVFNTATEAVKQGGARRGANMGVLRIDHPDILEFIACKIVVSEVANFNISVAVTDSFMQALEQNTLYPLIDPQTEAQYKNNGVPVALRAADVWNDLVNAAWSAGEPGIVFIDRMNASNPTHAIESIEATNPCGEQPLPPYDSCNLGSVNLGAFTHKSGNSWDFDWEELRNVIQLAVRFLDNVVEANRYPIPQIREQSLANRRIGLGVMGWADALAMMQLPYNSEAAYDLGERVFAFFDMEGKRASSKLAEQRGVFPNWGKSTHCPHMKLRNATVTTVAPTGTISIIAGCSSGIEPFFAVSYVRTVMDGTRLVEINPLFERVARARGFYSDALMARVARQNSIQDMAEIPADTRALFRVAADLGPEEHLRMQAVFQKNCDSSVSKTINLPASATRDVVDRAYREAWRLGLKGVTVYRDRSRPGQVLATGGPDAGVPDNGPDCGHLAC